MNHNTFTYFLHPRLLSNVFNYMLNCVLERRYAWLDSERILNTKTQSRRLLFVDGGAHLGQGFNFFSSYFPPGKVEYDVFEPNPNCMEQLSKNLSGFDPLTVRIHQAALSTRNGVAKLFGIAENEGGALSKGASIKQHQYNLFFNTNLEDAISVPMIDFCNYLKNKSEYYDTIIVKLDIEGAENDILEKLIERDCLGCIDTLYVEFHSWGMKRPRRRFERQREARLIKHLKKSKIHFRRWH